VAVEGKRLLELGLAVGPAAGVEELFTSAQPGIRLVGQRPDPGVAVGGLLEAAGGDGGGRLLPDRRCGDPADQLEQLAASSKGMEDDGELPGPVGGGCQRSALGENG
jgi:hypothetical protein